MGELWNTYIVNKIEEKKEMGSFCGTALGMVQFILDLAHDYVILVLPKRELE